MPRHADEHRTVVTVVGRPPVLRRCHHLDEVLLQGFHVEGLKLFCVVEVLFHRIGQVRMLVEHREVQLIRPPVGIRPRPASLRSRSGNCRVRAFADTSGVLFVGRIDPPSFGGTSLEQFLRMRSSVGRCQRLRNKSFQLTDTDRNVPKGKVATSLECWRPFTPRGDRRSAEDKVREAMVKLSAMRLTKAAELVEARAHETLTYFASFPSNRSRQVKTNNPLERIIREIRRRTRV